MKPIKIDPSVRWTAGQVCQLVSWCEVGPHGTIVRGSISREKPKS